MDKKPQAPDVKTMSANFFLKGIAVVLVYVFLAHPSGYITIWERRNWYVILCGIVGLPILLRSCAEILLWRVRIESSTIEIRSLRGVLRRQLADIAELERTYGRILIVFADGTRRIIPSIVGNLDDVRDELESRRGNS